MQAGNVVDDSGEESGYNECVTGAGDDIRNLDVKLLPVVVQPTAVYDTCVNTVKTDDPACAKEGVEDQADHSCDTVLGEHVHTIVNSDPELDWR